MSPNSVEHTKRVLSVPYVHSGKVKKKVITNSKKWIVDVNYCPSKEQHKKEIEVFLTAAKNVNKSPERSENKTYHIRYLGHRSCLNPEMKWLTLWGPGFCPQM